MDGLSFSKVRIHPDALSNRIGDQMILVHLDTDRIFQFNQTGARFWELLTANHDLSEIQQVLLQEFDIQEAELAHEIQQVLTVLEKEQFILADHGSQPV